MNLLEMRDALRAKIGNPATSEVSNVVLNRQLNDAQLFIASRYPFDETRVTTTIPTVAATSTYALPSNLLAILRLWDGTNFRKLTKRSVRFVSMLREVPAAGEPTSYVRIGSTIQLLPTPGGAYTLTLYYLKAPATLALDADIPAIPLSWHDGIVAKARHLYYDERGDVAKAIYANNVWKDWLSDKPSEIDIEKMDSDFGVEVPELSGYYAGTDDRAYREAMFDITE